MRAWILLIFFSASLRWNTVIFLVAGLVLDFGFRVSGQGLEIGFRVRVQG